MDHQYGNGSWMMVPTPNHDHHSLHPQYHQPHQSQPPPPTPPPQQQQPHQQSLASHFNLIHLIESLAEAIETGSRDQHSDALVNELTNHFEKCQQLLNSISGSINTKSMDWEIDQLGALIGLLEKTVFGDREDEVLWEVGNKNAFTIQKIYGKLVEDKLGN